MQSILETWPPQVRIKVILGQKGYGKTSVFLRDILPNYIYNRKDWFKLPNGKRFLKGAIIDTEINENYDTLEFLNARYPYPEKEKALIQQVVKRPIPIKTRAEFLRQETGIMRVMPGANERASDFIKKIFDDITNNINIRDCFILLEDTKRFLPGNNQMGEIEDMIINAKQRKMDLIMMFHFWEHIPPSMIPSIEDLYLLKTDTSVESRRKDIKNEVKYQKILAAEQRINAYVKPYTEMEEANDKLPIEKQKKIPKEIAALRFHYEKIKLVA